MKTIGSRRQAPITERASGEALAEGARFSEAVAKLTNTTFIPKGIYRFKTHEAANQHQRDCLARGMGTMASERTRDGSNQPPGDD